MSIKIRAQLVQVRQLLDDAQKRHAEVEFALKYARTQLDEIQQEDSSLEALSMILEQINRLEQQDSVALLWGESCTDSKAEQNRRRIETYLKNHEIRASSIQKRITELLNERARLEQKISSLMAELEELQHELCRIPAEPAVKPELTQLALTRIVLPWSNKRNDALRLRVIMVATFIITALSGYIVPRWKLPEPERVEYIEIPERLATLIVKKTPPPPAQEQLPREEQAEQEEAAETETAPEEKDTSDARKTAEKTGLLAFKQDFIEIMDASANIKMGSQASILKQVPGQRRKPGTRSFPTARVELPVGSTVTTANVRITDVIGDDNKLKAVEFTHIENSAVAALDSKQPGSSKTLAKRTDEEIQVVFDRYKDALYRIYNRELRKNSFLKGKLVLQLTIEPDGKVSDCVVNYSDLNSKELEKKIIARVLRFNFGDKQGVSKLTILYPIEFLPSS